MGKFVERMRDGTTRFAANAFVVGSPGLGVCSVSSGLIDICIESSDDDIFVFFFFLCMRPEVSWDVMAESVSGYGMEDL